MSLMRLCCSEYLLPERVRCGKRTMAPAPELSALEVSRAVPRLLQFESDDRCWQTS